MYIFYPLLKVVHDAKITADDGYYDILFLGGSVLFDAGEWAKTKNFFQEKLKTNTKLPIRIHNVARPSHSSLDSLFKYRFLADKHFDQVVVYDSINEVRANNCPPEMFKKTIPIIRGTARSISLCIIHILSFVLYRTRSFLS
jgi:hypothetical protein